LMLPADIDEVTVEANTATGESWIDTQVEHSDKSNEF